MDRAVLATSVAEFGLVVAIYFFLVTFLAGVFSE
jgi:hypothetical protein